MLTLLLVGALCTSNGCVYMDFTKKFGVQTDVECAQMANFANDHNRQRNRDERFSCLEPSAYRNLVSREL